MKSETENTEAQNTATGTAGISAGANAPSPQSQICNLKFEIPQHLLDYCIRTYPPHLGSAYDGARAHLIARRLIIEGHPASQSMPSMKSILSALKSQTPPQLPPVPPIPSLPDLPQLPQLPSPTPLPQPTPKPAHQENISQPQNPPTTLPLQQNKPAQNPPRPAQNAPQPGSQPAKPAAPEPKPARAKYEPKRGPRGFLNQLPEATQQKILDLLEDNTAEEVIDLLAQPAPAGIGYRTSRRSLQRFEARHRTMEQRAEIQALAEAAHDLIKDPKTTDADLTNAALRIIRARVLEYANDIENFESLERLNTVVYRLRRADIADRRQTYLERAKPTQTKRL